MRIGYFSTHFDYKNRLDNVDYTKRYHHSGIEVATYNLAIKMAQRGHEINVFTTSIDSKDSIERYENITIYRYGTKFKIAVSNISPNILLKPIRYQIDVVHAHIGNPIAALAGLRYSKRKNIPSIVTYHGDPVGGGGLIRGISIFFYEKYLINKFLSHAKVIISPSEYYVNESRFLGKYRDKIVVIPNGINIEDFDISYSKEECRERLGLPLDKNLILFFGVLIERKGVDILIKAMPKVIKNSPDTKLVIAGEGWFRKRLEKLSQTFGIENHVEFTGYIKEENKPLYYKATDLFVLPSLDECFGIVNLEAMACGTPIVASNVGGIPEIIKDKENGLLTPPKDPDALANAITYLLENEDVREKIGRNGRKKVEDYSWDEIAEETEKVYKGAII